MSTGPSDLGSPGPAGDVSRSVVEPAHRPSPRAVSLWAVNAALAWVVPVIAQIVWFVLDGTPRWPHLLVAALTLLLAGFHIVVVPRWRFAVHRWEISDTAVYTRTGWFTQERRIAPITRMQTVDTERGPLDRLFGLCTVTVTTASAAGAVKITALDNETADRWIAVLTEIAGRDGRDAT